jgi:alanine racemase
MLRDCPALEVEGVASHFASADEADKSFAQVQLQRFQESLGLLGACGFRPRYTHLCNSGGLLDLPEAYFNLVRPGILALGVHPSPAVRRLAGITPVMEVKARLVSARWLQAGDSCGYGPRFVADSPRRVATVPVGYGDGFPRLCNAGHVLIRGRRAPILGAVSMDALSVDITRISEAAVGDEVVLLGRSGAEEISAHDLARWKGSIVHDVLVSWSGRLPRVAVGAGAQS